MKNETWPRIICAVAAIILLLLAAPAAFAASPADGACFTKEEAQTCVICLRERNALREAAQKKEAERNQAVAAQNLLTGQITECRLQRQAFDLERLEWRDTAREEARRPTWWVVVGVGVGALLVGGATVWAAGAGAF